MIAGQMIGARLGSGLVIRKGAAFIRPVFLCVVFAMTLKLIRAVMLITELVTAILLYTQFAILRSRAILVLASGYLFTALIVMAYTLTFPRAFAPAGLLGAGLQTAGWLHIIWHFVFPASHCF